MSASFTKLSSAICDSTIWREPNHVRIVWITMLAMADAGGSVWAAVPGLADRARVSLDEVVDALCKLQAPDPWSRSKDLDGRRIVEIDGGWRLVNHAKYRKARDADERAEYKRKWDREHRPSGHSRAKGQDSPTTARQIPTKSDQSDDSPLSPSPPAPTPTPEKQKQRLPTVASCPEPQAAAGLDVVGTMPTRGGGEWSVTQEHLDTWTAAYPGIDVMAELRKAKAWLVSNPTNAKTDRGICRFCNGWLERAQNASGCKGKGPPAQRESLQARVARLNGLGPLFGYQGATDGRRPITITQGHRDED